MSDQSASLKTNIIRDEELLRTLSQVLKQTGKKIVVTIGSYDLIHVGHSRYLQAAAGEGDVLIVGVDSDRAIKIYKDETRPMVPEEERLEMLLHTQHVDWVTLIDDVDEEGSWGFALLRAVQPDVFIAVEDSYPPAQLEEIRKLVGELKILPRQAETSTSEQIRRAMIAQSQPLVEQLRALADQLEQGGS